jgi:hypothetical protein
VRSASIGGSILTKPNGVEKSQIYESESEMEEFTQKLAKIVP